MTTKAKNRLSQSYQSSPCFTFRRLPSVASGKQYYEVHDGVFNWAGSTLAVPDFGPVYGVHLRMQQTVEVELPVGTRSPPGGAGRSPGGLRLDWESRWLLSRNAGDAPDSHLAVERKESSTRKARSRLQIVELIAIRAIRCPPIPPLLARRTRSLRPGHPRNGLRTLAPAPE